MGSHEIVYALRTGFNNFGLCRLNKDIKKQGTEYFVYLFAEKLTRIYSKCPSRWGAI